jgi:7-carboxy-7-deazaguanine synthase
MNPTPHTATTLPVMEHFYTVQGEGAYSGVPAYFIRLGGCDVGCFWCDVKDSWDAEKHPKFTIAQIVSWVTDTAAKIAVITGGEPLMHNLDELTTELHAKGIRTHIETSGAHPLSGTWDWITFSPKKFKEPHPQIFDKAHELKIIAYNKHDFEWAKQYQQLVSSSCSLYLQPEWDKSEQMLPQIIEFVKQNHPWRISLQTHKFMNIP